MCCIAILRTTLARAIWISQVRSYIMFLINTRINWIVSSQSKDKINKHRLNLKTTYKVLRLSLKFKFLFLPVLIITWPDIERKKTNKVTDSKSLFRKGITEKNQTQVFYFSKRDCIEWTYSQYDVSCSWTLPANC